MKKRYQPENDGKSMILIGEISNGYRFFSNRELGKVQLNSEEITETIFNGIIAIYEKYQLNLSKDFPKFCPDNAGIICGFSAMSFKDSIKA